MPARWDGVAKRGVAAHVWLWLQKPVGEGALKRWMVALAAGGLKLDQSTNRTVQPHYCAAPVFEMPLRDPLAGRRTVLVEGWADAAELRIPDAAARAAYALAAARAPPTPARTTKDSWPASAAPTVSARPCCAPC